MSNFNDVPPGLELRDQAGFTLGFFVPKDALSELIDERDRLRKQLAALEAERDQYRETVSALLPKDFPVFTREELDEVKRDAIPLRQVLREIEQMAAGGGAGGSDRA